MEELDALLDRLREEVGTLPVKGPATAAATRRAPESAEPSRQRVSERFSPPRPRPAAHAQRREESPPGASGDAAWRENKEIILFGLLCSLIAVMVGVLSGSNYLILTGTVTFTLVSAALLLALFARQFGPARRPASPGSLAQRLAFLSGKVEALSRGGFPAPGTVDEDADPEELEREVAELREEVENLAQTLERRK